MKKISYKTLRNHQWKEFRRHPIFNREMALKIFMLFMLGMFGVQFIIVGFFLFDILSKYGAYNNAIGSFNYILIYLILFDFTIKYIFKRNPSIRIAPYLTLPIKRNKLFNFVLVRDMTNSWNLYHFFFLIPFVFRAIPAYYGYSGVVLYILFFYLLCVANTLLVNISNLLNRGGLYQFLPVIIVAAILGITFIPGINIEGHIVTACENMLEKNMVAWTIFLLVFAALWKANLLLMRADSYRIMQGEKASKVGAHTIPFVNKLGKYGLFLNLELKMIMRSKRLKQLPYTAIIAPILYSAILFLPLKNSFSFFYVELLTLGMIGFSMGQNLFTTESSFFDGLMTKKLSLLDMLKSKYIFYVFHSTFVLCFLMIPVFIGKLDFLHLISIYFYTIGPLYFVVFQNAVYNKKFFNHSHNKSTNIDLISTSTIMISFFCLLLICYIAMFLFIIFNETIACYFMLITGLTFTFTANYWLKWTYNRFLKRKYKNMAGFRIET